MEFKFIRKVNYYETDQMAIVHHSNYFRYFEEARIAYLDHLGYSYHRLEEMGIISPLLSISCDYIKPLHFNDEFEVVLKFISSTGTKFEVSYEIYKDNELTSKGYSKHCYLNKDNKVISIKKHNPEFYNILQAQLDNM